MNPIVDAVLNGILGGGSSVNEDPSTTCGAETDVCAAIDACSTEDACAAAWQATYQYYADRQFDMAKWQALMGVIATYLQYVSADRTADQQYDIADRQMVIAEEEYARYKCVYVECENQLAAEICAETVPEVDYDIHADRALRDVRKQFGMLRQKLDRSRQRYCASDYFRRSCELEKAEAMAVIAARESAYRYAEKRRDFLEARRWERRVIIMQHGRNVFAGQSSSYNSGAGYGIAALQTGQDNRNGLYSNLYNIGNNLLGTYYNGQMGPYPFGVSYTQGAGGSGAGGPGGGLMSGIASGVAP